MVRPRYQFLMILVLVGVTACASSDGSPTSGSLGSAPSGVTVVLTSDVEKRPFTEEELALPGLWPAIQACQNQQPFGECHLKKSPINNLTIFDRSVHEHVIALISLSGVEAGRTYAVEMRIYNPYGVLFAQTVMFQTISSFRNPAVTQNYWFTWTPKDQATWLLGRWKMSLFVNGGPEIERSFEVVEGALCCSVASTEASANPKNSEVLKQVIDLAIYGARLDFCTAMIGIKVYSELSDKIKDALFDADFRTEDIEYFEKTYRDTYDKEFSSPLLAEVMEAMRQDFGISCPPTAERVQKDAENWEQKEKAILDMISE